MAVAQTLVPASPLLFFPSKAPTRTKIMILLDKLNSESTSYGMFVVRYHQSKLLNSVLGKKKSYGKDFYLIRHNFLYYISYAVFTLVSYVTVRTSIIYNSK